MQQNLPDSQRSHRPSVARPLDGPQKASYPAVKSLRIPSTLQGIAQGMQRQTKEAEFTPRELQTTRLRPTNELPEEYKSGAVEGNTSYWRDQSLRGNLPGPGIRQSSTYQTKKTTGETLEKNTPILSQTKQNEMNFNAAQRKTVQETEKRLSAQLKYRSKSVLQRQNGKLKASQQTDQVGRFTKERYGFARPGDVTIFQTNVDKIAASEEQGKRQALRELNHLLFDHIYKQHFQEVDEEQLQEMWKEIIQLRETLLQDNNDSKLPLEYFDSEAFEVHAPQTWLTTHSSRVVFPDGEEVSGPLAYSRYLCEGHLSLEPCVVVGYSAIAETYQIRWLVSGTKAYNQSTCESRFCRQTMLLNQIKDFRQFDGLKVPTNKAKSVKRLNLLFFDEIEPTWWRRRESARDTRRIFDREINMTVFLEQNAARAQELKRFYADSSYLLEFDVSDLHKFLADVSGVTAEIVDNIFHKHVLYDQMFKRVFLSKLSQPQYKSIIVRCGQLVTQVSQGFIEANMIATLDFLRRSEQFERHLQELNLSVPYFSRQTERSKAILCRFIATLSGEFCQDPVLSLQAFLARQARIKTLLFQGKTQFLEAFQSIFTVFSQLQALSGFYLFNFAAIIPYVVPDQIELIQSGFAGGPTGDKEAYQVFIGERKQQKDQEEDENDMFKAFGQVDPDAEKKKQEKAAEEARKNQGLRINSVPFYAHPSFKGTDVLGTISPALPLPIKQFDLVASEQFKRVEAELNQRIYETLGDVVLEKLKTSNIDVSIDSRTFQDGLTQLLGMEDYYSLPSELYGGLSGAFEEGGLADRNCSGNCLERPRPRNLFDLPRFFKMVNLRLYDIITFHVRRSSERFLQMLGEFRVRNTMTYGDVITQINQVIKQAKCRTISVEDVQKLIEKASHPVFQTSTVTPVKKALIQLFLSLDPFVKEVRAVQDGAEQQYFLGTVTRPAELEHRSSVDPISNPTVGRNTRDIIAIKLGVARNPNIKEPEAQEVHDEPIQEQEDKAQHFNFNEYTSVLTVQAKVCPVPTTISVEPRFIPGLQETRRVLTSVYQNIIDTPSHIQVIDAKTICLQALEHEVQLKGPDEAHDPWIPEDRALFEQLMAEAECGPVCLMEVLQFVIRQLYYLNATDFADEQHVVKVLPYLDDFVTNDAVASDIANPEDQYLIDCADWSYEVKAAEPVVNQKQAGSQNESPEADTDDEEEQEDEAAVEKAKEVVQSAESPIQVKNNDFSLRDLRHYLVKLSVIQQLLRNIPEQLQLGIYTVDTRTAVEILLKRVGLIKAQVCRILQIRTTNLARQIIEDWKYINEQMHNEAREAKQYHDAKLFLENIRQTIKEMEGKAEVLKRYVGVAEEFELHYQDHLRVLYQAEEHFTVAANLDLTENKRNQLFQTYEIHLLNSFGADKEKWDDVEKMKTVYLARVQPKLILKDRDTCIVKLNRYFKQITEQKTAQKGQLIEQISQFYTLTQTFMQNNRMGNEMEINTYKSMIEQIKTMKEQLRQTIAAFNQDEKYLGFPVSAFPDFTEQTEKFQIFEELWDIIGSYQQKYAKWNEGKFNLIDPKEVQNSIAEWGGSLQRLSKQFQKDAKKDSKGEEAQQGSQKDFASCCFDASQMALDLYDKVENFAQTIPLINALRNPGLTKAHWRQISVFMVDHKDKEADITVEDLTLTYLLNQKLLEQQQLEQVIRISNNATREATIQKQLEKMTKEISAQVLEFKLFTTDHIPIASDSPTDKNFKDQEYYVVRGQSFDEAAQIIDEQFSSLQGIKASAYGAKFLRQVETQEKKLDNLQRIIDNWIVFQRLWVYLHPIFSSDDIKKQMPTESTMFQDVCQYWSLLTSELSKKKSVLDKMADYDKLDQILENKFQIIEEVNKKLSNYLQSKRMSFSRFFFLADEELLQILAQTRNVEAVQQHIQKCFEGIKRLTFQTLEDGRKIITELIAPEGEIIPIEKAVQTAGDVDLWLSDIETQMKLTIKSMLQRRWKDYVDRVKHAPAPEESQNPYLTLMGPREQWLANGPAQIVNVLSQVVWTYETEEAIAENKLSFHYAEWNNRIDRLVLWVGCTPDTVKQYPAIKYDKSIRKMLTTLLTLWVHNRDIIQKLIKKAEDPDFLFSSQLKYYLDEKTGRMLIKQVDATLDYQYEYLGNHDRLVITPLTDKCFLTLTSALAKTFGGNPLGPAGTGKSETTKDLAKSLAIGCYIFNCSEGLNEQSISRFFMGLCICGMFSCLDEFNRCRLDVLSVVAQQILSIQRAIRANKKQFEFEGVQIKLQSCCGIFITMNPGYAGRAELPTNLKNLFRPIAMTVPDYTMIAEISLFACGYRQASALAVKMVMTLRLSSEQLSKASHYDFGMRALKSILNAASRLKRLYWAEPEDILCLRALCDVNVPKFLAVDLPLFNNIISDLFMDCYQVYQKQNASCPTDIYDMPLSKIDASVDADHLVRRFVYDSALALKLTPTPTFIDKAMQLYATMTVRHGLMNVGLTMTGKTAVLQTVQAALGQIRQFLNERTDLQQKYTHEAYPLFYPVQLFKINAKSITSDELYGSFSQESNEWSDGILCTVMRQCVREAEDKKLQWILLDSPVDALWIENLNTILDDAKRLCLTSGEVIAMTDQMTYMFEVRDLEVASPATVSRCGMIFFDHTVVELSHMFAGLCKTMLPQWFQNITTNVQNCWPVASFDCSDHHVLCNADQLTVTGKTAEGTLSCTVDTQAHELNALDRLQILFDWLFKTIYTVVYTQCKSVIFQKETTIVYSLVKLLASYLGQFKDPNADEIITEDQAQELLSAMPPLGDRGAFVDSIFTFCLAWSLGGTGDQQMRSVYTQAFRHFAYDLPAMLIYNAQQSGTDLNNAHFKAVGSLGKTNAAQLEAMRQRAEAFQGNYKKTFPFGKRMLRMERQILFDDGKKAKAAQVIQSVHDVCVSFVQSKNLGASGIVAPAQTHAKQALTALTVAESREADWCTWATSQYAIPVEELRDVNKFSETIVPTPGVVSLLHVISLLSQANFPILLAGTSGSGKTSLAKKLAASKPWTSVKCVLTAQTTSTQLRSVVDTKIERRRKGIYGFPKGKKALFFVDDAHMPLREEYGAQPPLEVLRQLFEDQGWYDIAQGIFKKIINMATIIGCTTSADPMILPERLMHHLTLVSVPENSDEAFRQIFTVLMSPLAKMAGSTILDNVVLATIALYREVCDKFKPTPAHTHYIFGSRDLSKIFQGMLLILKNASVTEQNFKQLVAKPATITGLWVSECQRVFADRLICAEDKRLFNALLSQTWSGTEVSSSPLERSVPEGAYNSLEKAFDASFGCALSSGDCYYSYMNFQDTAQVDQVQQYYQQALNKYNRTPLVTPMNLILFRYALVHLVRVTRMLQSDRGHGLLIGMPSSGKRSLTRLAFTSIESFYTSQEKIMSDQGYTLTNAMSIQVFEPSSRADFLDIVRKAVIHCGQNAQPGLLVVQEALTDNYCLECINFLISLGEIPSLFNVDDTKLILQAMEDEFGKINEARTQQGLELLDTSKQAYFEYIAERVLRNLHIIIAVTPGSQALDRIVTSFPSLLGSLTVDWFTPWEVDTLRSIARYYLKQEENAERLVEVLVKIHQDTEEKVARRYPNLCTSPATFLGLIQAFQNLKKQQMAVLKSRLNEYVTGVQKMEETDSQVKVIQSQQQKLQPVLIQKQAQVRKLQQEIEEKKKQMVLTSEILAKEEAKASKAKAEADELAAVCEEEVKKAMPIKIRAERALGALKTDDVAVMKKMGNPPESVKLVMEAVCVILRAKITPGADNWALIRQQFSNPKLLIILREIKTLTPDLADMMAKHYVMDERFQAKAIEKSSVPAAGLCEWIHALYDYYVVMLDIQPKLDKEAQAKAMAKELAEALEKQQAELRAAQEIVAQLEKDGQQKQDELKKLNDEYQLCCDNLTRAEQLISGLAGESKRWKEQITAIEVQLQKVVPTSLVATAYCAQLGGMELVDRGELARKWQQLIVDTYKTDAEPLSELLRFSLDQYLYDVPTISQWISKGLGKDGFSLQSAAIAMNAVRVPLLLDPQGQGRIWAQNCLAYKTLNKGYKVSKVVVARYSDQNLQKLVKEALTNGYALVIEQIGSDEFLRNDARVKAAIQAHNKIQSQWAPNNQQFTVQVTYADGKDIEVPESFRLCLITTFDVVVPPDQYNEFRVITFKTTKEALQDLLINAAVERDDKKSEELRLNLTTQIAGMQADLLRNERDLLENLVNSTGSPIENQQLIDLVKKLSAQSVDVKKKMERAQISQKENEEKRMKYKQLAGVCASLFFVLLRLVNLDPMYDNSLQNFIQIFIQTMVRFKVEDPEAAVKPERLGRIQQSFAEKLYQTVSRGLFVTHKMAFSLDIALTLEQAKNTLSAKQAELFAIVCSRNLDLLKGALEIAPNKLAQSGVTDSQWKNLWILFNTGLFAGLVPGNVGFCAQIVEEKSQTVFNAMEELMITMLLKDSAIQTAATKYINAAIGPAFTNTEAPQLIDICKESLAIIPTLILLSADSDPSSQIVQLAETSGIVPMNVSVKVRFVSMGRGQGVLAEKAITEAVTAGGWVILGNTHLAGGWLQKLESIVESLAMENYDPQNTGKPLQVHDSFRLFLTTMPFNGFPASVIRQATKVSAEAPMGVKNNFVRLFKQLEPEDIELVPQTVLEKQPSEKQQVSTIVQNNYRKYLWALGTFFSAVLERRRFGPIGFSTGYDWADPDFMISKMQLRSMFHDLLQWDMAVLPEKMHNCVSALRFLISEINVGGRVSDHKDQLIVNSMMDAYYQETLDKLGKTVADRYALPAQLQHSNSMEEYVSYIKGNWADTDAPELFGLDGVSTLIANAAKGRGLLQTYLEINVVGSGSTEQGEAGAAADAEFKQIQLVLDELPGKFNLPDVLDRYPTNYNECMNTVLTQECTRYNKLHGIVTSSLQLTQRALKGLVLKTKDTEAIRQALRMNAVPEFWAKAAWPSLMSLSAWLLDFRARFAFLKDWVDTGKQEVVWFSGFFYPQAFITGTNQNYARSHKIPIDKLAMDFEVCDILPAKSGSEQVLRGLFLQGAGFNKKMEITDAIQQFEDVKYLKLKPMLADELNQLEAQRVRYRCPVFRTTLRKGVLTTTGHSSNYIFDVLVDCEGSLGKNVEEKKENTQKWVRRGTAMFQQKE